MTTFEFTTFDTLIWSLTCIGWGYILGHIHRQTKEPVENNSRTVQ